MDKKSSYSRYMDLLWAEEYTARDGEQKTKWHQMGCVWSTPHHTSMYQRIDTIPVGFDGKVVMKVRDDWAERPTTEAPKEDATITDLEADAPIDVTSIPF